MDVRVSVTTVLLAMSKLSVERGMTKKIFAFSAEAIRPYRKVVDGC